MGNLADFLAAVDATTRAGLAMDTAAAVAEERALVLRGENETLRAEIERLKAAAGPAPVPSNLRTVNLWDFRGNIGGPLPPSYFTHPQQTSQVTAGRVFRVRTGLGRSEMGLHHPTLKMVAKEPLDVQRVYRLQFAVIEGALLASKVNLFQFWAKSGENPVFACELTKDRLRFVQKVTGKFDRRILLDIPFARESWYDVEVKAAWSGATGVLGLSVKTSLDAYGVPSVIGPTTYEATAPEFKWGAYCPNYLANNEPEPVQGPEFTAMFSQVEVLEAA